MMLDMLLCLGQNSGWGDHLKKIYVFSSSRGGGQRQFLKWILQGPCSRKMCSQLCQSGRQRIVTQWALNLLTEGCKFGPYHLQQTREDSILKTVESR